MTLYPIPRLMDSPQDLWAFLVWGDSGLPTGGFALSHGLETLVEEGQITGRESIGQALRCFLHEIGTSELIAYWHVAGAADQMAAIQEAEHSLSLLPWPDEMRQASQWHGQRLLEILSRLVTEPANPTPGGPIYGGPAAAVLARQLTLDHEKMAITYIFTAVSEMASAAARLVRIDPLAVTGELWGVRTEIVSVVRTAASRSLSELGGISPWLEVARMRHGRQSMRLFRT